MLDIFPYFFIFLIFYFLTLAKAPSFVPQSGGTPEDRPDVFLDFSSPLLAVREK